MKAETQNPNAISEECAKEWISHTEKPGGFRGVLGMYRAVFKNTEINVELKKSEIAMPVMAIGTPEFFRNTVERRMRGFTDSMVSGQILEECGHSPALEVPECLTDALMHFLG